jgi:hypothetical protein
MKIKIISICLLLLICSCSEDDPGVQMGCLSGVTGGGDRITIRCCTKQEFQAGSNVNAGGTANWNLYTQHQWKAVSDCDKCW